MTEGKEKDTQCPICLSTLNNPRIHTCGHNFCYLCLVEHCKTSGSNSKCPLCREKIEDIDSLIHNKGLENFIKNKDTVVRRPLQEMVMSGNALQQFRDKAVSYMKERKFFDALETLRGLILQEKEGYKLLCLIKKIYCQVELGKTFKATKTAREIEAVLENPNFVVETDDLKQKCDKGIAWMVDYFVKLTLTDTALILQRSRYHLIKCSYEAGDDRLNKLERLGGPMQRIAKEMNRQKKSAKFKNQQYIFMDSVLHEMQVMKSLVSVKKKSETIAWFLKYYATCCNYSGDYTRSIQINNKAICLMETVFGIAVGEFRVLGLCYNNLGAAYENANVPKSAMRYYCHALMLYDSAKDWRDDISRDKEISRTVASLNAVEEKLQEM